MKKRVQKTGMAAVLAGSLLATGCESNRIPSTGVGPPTSDTLEIMRAFGTRIAEEADGRALLHGGIYGRDQVPYNPSPSERALHERLTRAAAGVRGVTWMAWRQPARSLLGRLCVLDYTRSFKMAYAIGALSISRDTARIEVRTFDVTTGGEVGVLNWGATTRSYSLKRTQKGWHIGPHEISVFTDGVLVDREPKGYVRRTPSTPDECRGL